MNTLRDLIMDAHALGLDTVGMTEDDIQHAIWERNRADAELRTECHHRRLDATGTFGEVCRRLAQTIGIGTVGVTESDIVRAILQKRDAIRALRKECYERGLSVNGTGDELRSRLATSESWPKKIARLAATGVRSMLDACVEEIAGDRVAGDTNNSSNANTECDSLQVPATPPIIPPHIGSTPQEIDQEAPPLRVPPRLLASPAIPQPALLRPSLPEVMPRQQITPPQLLKAKTPMPAPNDHWGLRFPAYDADRVRRFLHSHQTNDLHPFHGFQGNPTATDTALNIAQAAYTRFATDGDKVFCTRQCPARLALVAFEEDERRDFARRFGRLLGTPFVEINSAEICGLIRFCQDGWNANTSVREHEIETWPLNHLSPHRIRTTLPPMSVFVDRVPTDRDACDQLVAALTGTGVIRIVVSDREFEYDLSRVCFMVGVDQFCAAPSPFRSAFSPLQVGRPFLVWGRDAHDAIFGNDWTQRLKKASRIIAAYDELRWLIAAADSTAGHFHDLRQFFALEGLLGVLYEVGEHPNTSTNSVVRRGWELHSSFLQDDAYLRALRAEIERRTKH